jgi:uncharacterized repeat protein (TIGR03803 family)
MRSGHTVFRCVLLGSALALAALAPAFAANGPRDEVKRMRAIQGNHPHIARVGKNGASASGSAGGYTVLHSFTGDSNDGGDPTANVTLDKDGNIYGTAGFGGAHGDGVVFELAPDGTQTILHSFNGSDGSGPDGSVIFAKHGGLFGTAGSGGSSGNGVIFKLSSKGKYKVVHDFSTTDGSFIRGDLISDKDGNLYGTALFGGDNDDGTVYEYAADGTFSVLHAFNGTDGEFAEHGVVRDKDGNLYGVTAFGGSDDEGTVYKLAPNGTLTTLHNFTGGGDGGFLYGGLDIDKNGNLYGSTAEGGANDQGTVFEIANDGTFTTLYSFTGGADGGSPESDVLFANGSVYGVADAGGDESCQCGVLYKVTLGGEATALHTFTGSDGAGYSAGIIRSQGAFYGTSSGGGADGDGVVFSLTKQ